MLGFSNLLRYYFYNQPTDMRKGFDGLGGIVRNKLLRDPAAGDVFIFINGAGTHIKILFWDGDGFVIYCKRLERGTFKQPCFDTTNIEIKREDLLMILSGKKLETTKKKRDYLSRRGC
jgi:transposase